VWLHINLACPAWDGALHHRAHGIAVCEAPGSLPIDRSTEAGRVAQVVKCLPFRGEALSSNPSTPKKYWNSAGVFKF
jgi:hypothetical protein